VKSPPKIVTVIKEEIKVAINKYSVILSEKTPPKTIAKRVSP
jgi:hypothetical protein